MYSQGDCALSHANSEIENTLWRAMETRMNETRQICQPRLLQTILNKEVIMPLFSQYKVSLPDWQNEDIHALCDEVHRDHIRVLALLVLFGRGCDMIHLRNEGVSDATLPLRYLDACAKDLHLDGQAGHPLKCFQSDAWKIQMKIDICQKQWLLDVPYMRMGPNDSVEHTDFSREVILPWCEPKPGSDNMTEVQTRTPRLHEGGYSRVERVYITPAYHGFGEILEKVGLMSSSDNYFALKTLNSTSDDKLKDLYEKEIHHLKTFSGTVCPHLVTLLTTFTHQEQKHFLFPWATYDLSAYWEKEQTKPHDLQYARWLSKQLMGLAEAVKTIHCPDHISSHYGRHSDLKPDNILWYRPYKGDPNGILVVSDMGFTVAHRTYSRSKDPASQVARTPEYRPPELDTKHVFVSRKYDVWTLGCVFLEMLIWFLGGWEEMDAFKKARRAEVDILYGAGKSTFYTLTQREYESGFEANVKQSVMDWIEYVRQHENRSQFTDAVVDVIQKRMIVVDPDKRKDMNELREEFTNINLQCQYSQNYCIPWAL